MILTGSSVATIIYWQNTCTLTYNYKDDLKFLYHLVDKYFMGLTHNANLDEMRELPSCLTVNVAMNYKIKLPFIWNLAELIDAL
jgi:hypothetical protein